MTVLWVIVSAMTTANSVVIICALWGARNAARGRNTRRAHNHHRKARP